MMLALANLGYGFSAFATLFGLYRPLTPIRRFSFSGSVQFFFVALLHLATCGSVRMKPWLRDRLFAILFACSCYWLVLEFFYVHSRPLTSIHRFSFWIGPVFFLLLSFLSLFFVATCGSVAWNLTTSPFLQGFFVPSPE
jgi:hypothetical protein